MLHQNTPKKRLDVFTRDLLNDLYASSGKPLSPPAKLVAAVEDLLQQAEQTDSTDPIIDLFVTLKAAKRELNLDPEAFNIPKDKLLYLSEKHRRVDEHEVTLGGRINMALPIVKEAERRIENYLKAKDVEAPSGIELWSGICENAERIKATLNIGNEEWNSYSGQIRHCIDSVKKLSTVVELSAAAVQDITRATKNFRMRLTPYYTSLIQPGRTNDPVLLQSVPTAKMVDNVGLEIPPVAADHSPARLIDQFYPQTVTIKATNMCAMYCTHCLRIAHIGKKDRIYSAKAYAEALKYIRRNTNIRDVLITGGDALVLPNQIIKRILEALDAIDHVKVKRLGTRIPVTVPWRADSELLDILEESNDRKPIRVVIQINTAQEITPLSKNTFKQISKRVSAVLNQAVLLRGVNDTKVKMWKLCETVQESYVRPYYVFNCSYRNPQFAHFRVPVEIGRDIVESMYGNISGDAIPRYIATAGGKIPLHRSNVIGREGKDIILIKPWSGEQVKYPDADPGS